MSHGSKSPRHAGARFINSYLVERVVAETLDRRNSPGTATKPSSRPRSDFARASDKPLNRHPWLTE